MRIVAGDFKGRAIDAPTGQGTRPTTDRVREALMSVLYSMRGGFTGALVLDAFAGSGALGLEALSRGARYAVFCERERKAQGVITRNFQKCRVDSTRAHLEGRDVMKSTPHCTLGAFDLVFLDPPYAYAADDVLAWVAALVHAGAVASSALVVYEHDLACAETVAGVAADLGFEVEAAKKYGKTGVTILRPSK